MLKVVSNKLDTWIQLLFIGLSSGIVVCCNSAKFIVEQTIIGSFSITLMNKNKIDNKHWTFTIVYDPVNSSLKE
jgi:hypothetical protein